MLLRTPKRDAKPVVLEQNIHLGRCLGPTDRHQGTVSTQTQSVDSSRENAKKSRKAADDFVKNVGMTNVA